MNRGFEVYVGNIDEQVNEPILYNFFSGCGPIVSLKIMRHIVTRKSRGFGFVNFAKKEDAIYAEERFDGKRILTNALRVYLKDRFKSIDKHANVTISNLPADITEPELKKLCEGFGKIFSIRISESDDETNGTKRAFVLFEDLQAAQKCIEELNDTDFRSNKLIVDASAKRDVIYIKGQYNSDIKEDLNKLLSKWDIVEIDDIEKTEDGKTYLTAVRFSDELSAKSFLQEFKVHREDCKIRRSNYQRMC